MTVLPNFDDAVFSDSTNVDNAYFPLPAGTITSFSGEILDPETGETETERNDFFVTFETKTISGVDAVVIRDTGYDNGVLIEDTLDWYAQDDTGNVWYLGEISIGYHYDDEGNFTGTSFDGSWETDVAGALPGWAMQAVPTAGLESYFQEFAVGVAEDVGEVLATDETVDIDFGSFIDVVKTLDTSTIDPGILEFKYFAPGVGQVLVEEDIDENGVPQLSVVLDNIREVDNSAPVDPADLAFEGDGTEVVITFLSEDASVNSAIGAYVFNTTTGEIGEGRMLFVDTEDTQAGATATVTVGAGESVGLFMIPDVDDIGIELADYLEGGLFFRSMLSGNVADLFDEDPSTTFTPGVATIYDGTAPVVTDADGNILPIRAFHSVGNRDGFNFLNPVAGENVLASEVGDGLGVEVVNFEDGLASTEDFDDDFDDAFLAVSGAPLGDDTIDALLDEIGLSRIVGTDKKDTIEGTDEDDQIIGLEGNDRLYGGDGDDVIEASDSNDRAQGGEGDDEITGEDGNDRLYGDAGEDEIDGGDGNDKLFGGDDDDLLEGGDGKDKLDGGDGYDTLLGGEGDDRLTAGGDGARMAGGLGDDKLIGEIGSADTFVFDLIDFGKDFIVDFEDGIDLIEIATYTGVTGFDDIEIDQHGKSTVLAFADGSITLKGFDAELVDASDFVFV